MQFSFEICCRWQQVTVWAHVRLRARFRPVSPTSLCAIASGEKSVEMEPKKRCSLSLFLFFPLSRGAAHNFFIASSYSLFHPPLSLVFFFQSSSSPAFLTSLLTQFSNLSLGLPRLLLPCSRNSAALFGSLSSAILSTCPAHCNLLLTSLSVKLLCTPVSSLNSTILRLSALVTLATFRTQLFWHTCNLCCCSSVITRVSVPYRHVGVTQVLTTLPLSLFVIRRSAITPSTALHTLAPACSLRRTSLSLRLPVSAHCPSCVHENVPLSQFLLSSSLSSSSLWWPMCNTSVFPRFIFSPCQVNSPFYSSSVSRSSCLPFATM